MIMILAKPSLAEPVIEILARRRNDVKVRTTLLLALLDKHQLRFSKYKTVQEFWAAILKTFGGNEATKKTKKNQLKQQYGNFKAKGSETMEQTFNRLQAIVSHLEFMDVEIKQDDLNQKGRRENYRQGSKEEEEAPKALMAIDGVGWDWSYIANEEEDHALEADQEAPTEFALMAKSSSDNEVFDNSLYSKACKKTTDSLNTKITELSEKLSDTKNTLYHYKLVNTASIPTASTQVSLASANVAAASISLNTACAYIASQIKSEDINQIDEDDIKEIDIKWNMALLTMRADKF
nr:hypothetical protein [Tanacetum cinerariifolium]